MMKPFYSRAGPIHGSGFTESVHTLWIYACLSELSPCIVFNDKKSKQSKVNKIKILVQVPLQRDYNDLQKLITWLNHKVKIYEGNISDIEFDHQFSDEDDVNDSSTDSNSEYDDSDDADIENAEGVELMKKMCNDELFRINNRPTVK